MARKIRSESVWLRCSYHDRPRASKRRDMEALMIRSFLTVSTGTLASRLLGFARDSMIAALLGTGPVADAFLVAFQLVNVVRRLLSEGALNAALVPRRGRRGGICRTRAGHRQRGADRGDRIDRPVDAPGHDGSRAGLCRTGDAATGRGRCPIDAALSRLRRPRHGHDGVIERASAFRADGFFAASVQHRIDRRNDRAAGLATGRP